MSQLNEIFGLLCSSAKIERDKGTLQLESYLNTCNADDISTITNELLQMLDTLCTPWETKHGALMGANKVLLHSLSSDGFMEKIKEHVIRCLEDSESRVRLVAGEVMGSLCKRYGADIYISCKEMMLEGVKSNLERQPHFVGDEHDKKEVELLMNKLSSSPQEGAGSPRERLGSMDARQIFHDTAGWKSLETWMKCLQNVVEGCGPKFNKHIDQFLLDLIFQTLTHTNRFVRETGYYVCATLVGCGVSSSEDKYLSEDNAIVIYGDQFANHLAAGLADNWSQVRLAASVATRSFLTGLTSEESQQFLPLLIPRMCLNRYYVAEGVRIYSQETWKQIAGSHGIEYVEGDIDNVVKFYISQTEADNHAVREAACACIAELGHKINKELLRKYVNTLLEALLVCFKDDSWPVRDAACIACGNFVACFPEEAKPSMDSLYPLFYENLQDNIPSVRQGAAAALGNVVRAYGNDSIDLIVSKIKEGLSGIETQENTEKFSSLEKVPATYGVVKRVRDHQADDKHTDQAMYSCGSLGPKMARGGGCMDHRFKRPSEPWELAEGCVFLVSELSHIPECTNQAQQLLPLVSKACSHQHYTQHVNFLKTVCEHLPKIGKGIGKRPFKMYIEAFLDPIFYSLACDNMLTSTAAQQCLDEIAVLIGPNILRGRIEQYNPKYLGQWSPRAYGP